VKKLFKSPVFWATYCAAFAVWNFVSGVLNNDWRDYAVGILMVALLAFNLYQIKKRKAALAVAKNDSTISHQYSNGGYIFPATPSKNEFEGLPFDFAVGEVYGLRMWKMDSYGRLRARNWDKAKPWRPGENVAECVEMPENSWSAMWGQIYSSSMGLSVSTTSPPKPPHDTPSEKCGCGFYAYTESHHADTLPYKDRNVVLGVIKGTGRTLMGTKGFRCEKAEIIALRDPTRGGTKTDPWRVEQLAKLKEVYPGVPIVESRAALLEFAPLTNMLPDPSTDEFWSMP
jgi:hypothetical protein